MCSRPVSAPANRLRKTRKKNSSAVPLFSKRSHIGNLRRIRKQGKGRSSKRKENRRCPFLFAHRRGYGVIPAAGRGTSPPSADGESPAEVQRKTLRPERANTLTQFECPAQSVQRKEPPRQGEHAYAVRAPRLFGAEKEPPVRGEHANAVRVPRFSGAEKEPPRQGEPASGSSSAPHNRCRKGAAPSGRTRQRQFARPAGSVQKKFLENFQKS